MKLNKKAGVVSNLTILVVVLLVFVIVMPILTPNLTMDVVEGYDKFTVFLYLGIPFFLFFAIVLGVILG